ncbi:MAG: DegV family protein [Coriobacteriales bacterium]
MKRVQVVTDSVASIPADLLEKHDIEVLSLYVNENGSVHEDARMDADEFYSRIVGMEDNIPTSSQPSQEAFEAAFSKAAASGRDVLGVFISSRMSGTFDGALLAARRVKERHPGWHACILDSTSNSFDEGYAAIAAADAAAEGAALDECYDVAVSTCARCRWLFAPSSLAFLKAGGRIGRASAMLGTLLKVSPILTVADGEVGVVAKVPTYRRALDRMVRYFARETKAHSLVDATVHYIGPSAPARTWATNSIEPLAGKKVRVLPVSPVIGVHVGPAVGIVYRCEEDLPGKLSRLPEGVLV